MNCQSLVNNSFYGTLIDALSLIPCEEEFDSKNVLCVVLYSSPYMYVCLCVCVNVCVFVQTLWLQQSLPGLGRGEDALPERSRYV